MKKRLAVILAGGSGERFWPVSTPHRPKQLLCLTHPTRHMLDEAIDRIATLVGEDSVFVSTSELLRETIIAGSTITADRVLAEPAKRNTLGALVWIVAKLSTTGFADASVSILTADHRIEEPEKFRNTVADAFTIAENEDSLVTIGVIPTRPETGFGYLESDHDSPLVSSEHRTGYPIKRFREKPSLTTAQEFIQSPAFYWNAGMMFFKISTFLSALESCQPEAFALYEKIVLELEAGNHPLAVKAFEELPNISIDYAVMEKAPKVQMIPADFPWDDVGSWDALERSIEPDANGNITQGVVATIDSANCIVINDDPSARVGILGLNNLLIVNTPHAMFVCPKTEAQRVKEISTAANLLSIE